METIAEDCEAKSGLAPGARGSPMGPSGNRVQRPPRDRIVRRASTKRRLKSFAAERSPGTQESPPSADRSHTLELRNALPRVASLSSVVSIASFLCLMMVGGIRSASTADVDGGGCRPLSRLAIGALTGSLCLVLGQIRISETTSGQTMAIPLLLGCLVLAQTVVVSAVSEAMGIFLFVYPSHACSFTSGRLILFVCRQPLVAAVTLSVSVPDSAEAWVGVIQGYGLTVLAGIVMAGAAVAPYVWLAAILSIISLCLAAKVIALCMQTTMPADMTDTLLKASDPLLYFALHKKRVLTLLLAIGFVDLYLSAMIDLWGGLHDSTLSHDILSLLDAALTIITVVVLTNAHIDELSPERIIRQCLAIEERNLNAKREFVRYVFHEVRNPLNALTLGMEEVQREPQLSAPAKETVSIMNDSLEMMMDILSDVQSYQNVEEGHFSVEMGFVKIVDMVCSILDRFYDVAAERNVSLRAVIDPEVPAQITADGTRLKQVVSNLLSNAIKFSNRDSCVEATVEVQQQLSNRITWFFDGNVAVPGAKNDLAQEGSYKHILVAVTNRGVGISPRSQQRLFTPFTQIRAGELQEGRGTGLGLAICRTIITLHGGYVGVESIPNDKTRFVFTIPFDEELPSEPAIHAVGASPGTPARGREPSTAPQPPTPEPPGGSGRFGSTGEEATYDVPGGSTDSHRSKSWEATPKSLSSPRTAGSDSGHLQPQDIDTTRSLPAELSTYARGTGIEPGFPGGSGLRLPILSRRQSGAKTRSRRLPFVYEAVGRMHALAEENLQKEHSSDREDASMPLVPSESNQPRDHEAANDTQTKPAPVPTDSTAAATGGAGGGGGTDAAPNARLGAAPLNGDEEKAEVAEKKPMAMAVDDVASNRKLVAAGLRRLGFVCDQAEDGVEAVAKASRMEYTLIMMDNVMPKMGGVAATRKILQLPSQHRPHIVGLTGNALAEDIEEFSKAGAEHVLIKPLQLKTLREVVGPILEEFRASSL